MGLYQIRHLKIFLEENKTPDQTKIEERINFLFEDFRNSEKFQENLLLQMTISAHILAKKRRNLRKEYKRLKIFKLLLISEIRTFGNI